MPGHTYVFVTGSVAKRIPSRAEADGVAETTLTGPPTKSLRPSGSDLTSAWTLVVTSGTALITKWSLLASSYHGVTGAHPRPLGTCKGYKVTHNSASARESTFSEKNPITQVASKKNTSRGKSSSFNLICKSYVFKEECLLRVN